MNNKIQRQFDRSIKDALAVTQKVADDKHAADKLRALGVPPKSKPRRARKPKGRLYMDPMTGGTVWEPATVMSDRFSFANLDHLKVFVAVLAHTGAMCPKCGYATRKTSKNWAKCKKCGTRIQRRQLP